MPATQPEALSMLNRFLLANVDLDPIRTDFYDPAVVARIRSDCENPDAVLAVARTERSLRALTDDAAVIDRLRAAGLDSAAAIAPLTDDALGVRLGGDLPIAAVAELRRRAMDLHGRAVHLFTQMTGALAPHARSLSGNSAANVLTDSFGHLPSFADLFGSQDYLEAPHCQTVVGPAAYFVDLMRVVSEQITNNPANDIAVGDRLRSRRQRLFTLALTCDMTLTPTPKIQVINAVIGDLLIDKGIAEPDYTAAIRVYPWVLPVNLRLARGRAALDAMDTSLAALYQTFAGPLDGIHLPDRVAIGCENLNLSPEQTALVTRPRTKADLSACFGGGDRLLSGPVSATVSIASDSLTVTGTGFAAITPGSVLRVGDSLRAVVSVPSDTQLVVDQAWPVTRTGAAGLFYVPDSLALVQVLRARAGLDDAFVADLFTQGLDATELAGGPAQHLYINADSDRPPVRIIADASDVSYLLQVIDDLDESRIDRLNRLVRLSRIAGVAVADLDWALYVIGGALTTDGLGKLWPALALARRLALPVDEACGLWTDIKTWGRGTGPRPADLFDRVFNATAAPGAYYRPLYPPNKLFTGDATPWILDDFGTTGQALRTWLAASLGVGDKDLGLIAAWVAQGAASLTLDVPTLSALWAPARLARAAGIGVADLLTLTRLAGVRRFARPADVDAVMDWKDTLAARGIALRDAAYAALGETDDLDGIVRAADIAPFLTNLRQEAVAWMLTPASFTSNAGVADLEIFDNLQWNQVINAGGAVLYPDWKLIWDVLTFCFRLEGRMLVVPGLSREEAGEAYNALLASPVITGDALAAPVTQGTDLSFLFPGVTDPELRRIKIELVRGVLINLTARVQLSRDVLVPALRTQTEGVWGLSGLLLRSSPAAAATVLGHILGIWFPGTEPHLLLLAPTPDPQVGDAVVLGGRIAYLAGLLQLKDSDLAQAAKTPAAFGLAGLQILDPAALRAWSDYVAAVGRFETGPETEGAIAAWLVDNNEAALTHATGWPASAVTALATALWGGAFVRTPDTLTRMEACFVLAARMGTDIGSCLMVAGQSRLAPMTADVPPPQWETYRVIAQALVDMLRAKSAGGDWDSTYKPVAGRENTVRRDAYVGMAVSPVKALVPGVSSVRLLSEYLLIDVETSACDVTSPIVEATAAVQTYLQRCRMSVESGVRSLGVIAEAWWPWLLNYRVWEANRKIFLYPENYIDPNLRAETTDLFRKALDAVRQNDVTPAAVERVFTDYLTAFAEVAKLQTVDAVRAMAPHPVSGTPVDTIFFLGRTEAKPYQYYVRSLRKAAKAPGSAAVDGQDIWTAWLKIDLAMSSPDATIAFVFNRLFVFWVEPEAVKGSYIKEGTQNDKTVRHANVRYVFQLLDKTWSAPQTVEADLLFDAQPTAYKTSVIDPKPGEPSVSGIDPAMAYWRRVFLQPALDPNGNERLLVLYGNAFANPANPGDIPVPPKSDTADERKLVDRIYLASQICKAAQVDTQGAVLLMQATWLDIGMGTASSTAYLKDFAKDMLAQPLGFSRHSSGMYGPISSRSILIDAAFSDAADYAERVVVTPYEMLSNTAADLRTLAIKNQAGWYLFDNVDEAFLMVPQAVSFKRIEDILEVDDRLATVKKPDGTEETVTFQVLGCKAYSDDKVDIGRLRFDFVRLSTGAVPRLIKAITFGGIDRLLSLDTQQASGPANLEFSRFKPTGRAQPPKTANGGSVDFNGAYSPYFSEIFFHLPFFLGGQLNAAQSFEEAKRWYEFIFDPAARAKGQKPDPSSPNSVFWQYLPFRRQTGQSLVETLTDQAAIEEWNANPFDPHAVARLRPVAYQKTIVMHYILNLLDWADWLFAQDTRESVNQATLLYLTAADLLGPRPRRRGTFQQPPPLDFDRIEKDYGLLIPQFLIELERVLPPPQPGKLALEPAPFNAISAYFAVPENDEFIAYWDRLEDRLFKVRNCLSLTGAPRILPLFAPPINPASLIRTGQEGSPGVVDRGLGGVPHYRFPFMLDRAKQFTGMVSGLGAALLSALEKRDAGTLEMLRLRHEQAVIGQTIDMKSMFVNEAELQIAAQEQSRQSAQSRLAHYGKLLDEGLSVAEVVSLATMTAANVFQTVGGTIRSLSGAAHLVPNAGSPFAMTYGGREIGSSLDSFSSAMDIIAGTLSFASTLSSVIAGYERRAQEWVLQKTVAGFEVAQIDAQIDAARIRLDALKRDVRISSLSLAQNQEIEKLLTAKFTSVELYNWLVSRLSSLYFQAYKLALDLSMAAQRAYQFEADSDVSFLGSAYWDAGRRGLTAGEGLQLGLSAMEQSYYAGNRRRLIVEKSISLWQLDPLALLDLRRKGTCVFDLSELLFDYDYPGHYCRKIERVQVTIPAVVGPYQNVHGSLTQMSSLILTSPDPNTLRWLLGKDAKPTMSALRMNWRAGQQIALSRGSQDGVISSAPGDERYLPFEGTGVVSSWRLDLPLGSNRIDFSSIADVVLTVTYSALDDRVTLAKVVNESLSKTFTGQVMLSLEQSLPEAWARFIDPPEGLPHTLAFPLGPAALPANLLGPKATKVYLLFSVTLPFAGPLVAELAPPSGAAVTLTATAKAPESSAAVDAALAPAGVWTLTLKTIPAELLQGGRLKPGALAGIAAVFDYKATLAG